MVYNININVTFGEVIGYIPRLNPFSSMARVIVRVNNKTVRIPVDHRQVKFIGKEYPVGSVVLLEYDGRWRIKSQRAPDELDLDCTAQSVYF